MERTEQVAKDYFKKFAFDEWKKKITGHSLGELAEPAEKWIEKQIDELFDQTHQIKKDSNRITAVSVMFSKRLTKLVKLIVILKDHDLTDEAGLFEKLAELI